MTLVCGVLLRSVERFVVGQAVSVAAWRSRHRAPRCRQQEVCFTTTNSKVKEALWTTGFSVSHGPSMRGDRVYIIVMCRGHTNARSMLLPSTCCVAKSMSIVTSKVAVCCGLSIFCNARRRLQPVSGHVLVKGLVNAHRKRHPRCVA